MKHVKARYKKVSGGMFDITHFLRIDGDSVTETHYKFDDGNLTVRFDPPRVWDVTILADYKLQEIE